MKHLFFPKLSLRLIEAGSREPEAGSRIKYAHSEVGSFSKDDEDFEQHEIEFLPVEPEEAVDQLLIAK